MRTLTGYTGPLQDIPSLIGTILVCDDGKHRQVDSYNVEVRPGHTKGNHYSLLFTDGILLTKVNGTALVQLTERW